MAWREAVQRVWWNQSRGLERMVFTALLGPLALAYGAVLVAVRLPWRMGWRHPQSLGAPVVVVGNLVIGGVGKTPVVLALVKALQQAGYRPGIVSRGYRPGRPALPIPQAVEPDSMAAHCGDEPLLLRRRAGVPVWVGKHRAEVARALLKSHPEVDVVVSDDGLQHLALPRDFQIIVFDARGAGNERVLPAGPLRERLPRRLPSRNVVVYNAARPSTSLPGACANPRLAGLCSLTDWWRGLPASPTALTDLQQVAVVAAAGIAHPERFFSMLEAAGLRIARLPLPDHAPLTPRPWPNDTRPVVVTEKDAVKLSPTAADAGRVHVATLDFDLPSSVIEAALAALPPPRHDPHGPPLDRTSGLPDLQGAAGTRS
jgi:tetraacyldisaccharide 4'-kinase